MIKEENLKTVLEHFDFEKDKDVYFKKFTEFDCELKVDFKKEKIIYPESKGLIVNDKTTSNFSSPENFVVFECVYKLLVQGYNPKHIELEKKWQLGHGQKSGKADICVKDNEENIILIIECKTSGAEYKKAKDILLSDSQNQLFSYLQQATSTKFLALYASDFVDDKVISEYLLINVTDNEELLENDSKLKSYKDAPTSEEKHKVWCDTYDKEYATIGLFENNKPYEIGKTKFTDEDLKDISSHDIQGKYHEFATILRQHNVSGRENAFDKLVNLFLCKVTDEKENPDELKFYYKGKAYDNPFAFQDRLQLLYKIGMSKFLGDDITYIANEKIDEAFEVFKNKPNATKDKIKEFVKELKFFTNNDFAFIDVHNEKLFYQNFEVLLKISQMIQDIKLTSSEENQFLGDMFEGFLDQGVKQSEGQFFTPMPIVKFIINSLPKKHKPKVIDYACGAGHFLNEYASQNPQSQIIGVEKEYRLSKVAKVSSFMYGTDMDIIYNDALTSHERLKENDFDVLIANPPYSVKGFLQTLSEEDRNSFELISAVDSKSYSKTGAIECFFLERAKQLLKKDAVVGIIVPSSILNKDTPKLYTKTREIILKYFDIIAIAEFGSGTFGKTGTNTVTLFLRKRGDNPDLAMHYKNMVDSWFECDFASNKAFKDVNLLEKYCLHVDIEFEIYKTILCKDLDDEIFEHETFKEYKASFEKSTILKELKKKKYYKDLSKTEKEKLEKEKLIDFIRDVEKDKLYYFMLASKQENDVVIVKSPTSTNEIKKFLGYEWGGRKGSEGIKYLSSVTVNLEEDEELESEDKRVLENLHGLKYINTPLYNPQNHDDENKINTIIRDNFENKQTVISDELEKFVSTASLVDMLDFSQKDFNKAFSLTFDKKVEIQSKWNLITLSENCKTITKGTTPTTIGYSFVDSGINFVKVEAILSNGKFDISKFAHINKECNKAMSRSQLEENDILFSIAGSLGRVAKVHKKILPANTNQAISIIRLDKSSNLQLPYLYEILKNEIIQNQINGLKIGVSQPNLSLTQIGDLKIPLPPIDIQNKIVKECQKIDDEAEKANDAIKSSNQTIKDEFNSLYEKANNSYRLSDENIFQAFIGKRVLSKDIEENPKDGYIAVFSANVHEAFGYTKKELIKDFSVESVLWGIDGDWMSGFMPKDMPFYPTDHCGVLRVKTEGINPRYLTFALEREGQEKRFSRANRASTDRVKSLSIKAPAIEEQNAFAKKVENLEKKIKKANETIEKSKSKKEEILKKYLQ